VVTVPAFVWRGGFFLSASMIGVGTFLGALAWLDSGLLAGLIVFVILSTPLPASSRREG
jgi:hypothetical protein